MTHIDQHSENFHFDNIMSLHRKAYEVHEKGGSLAEWLPLADSLGLKGIKAQVQFFKTARNAFNSTMTAKQAFPLAAELKALLRKGEK